MPAPAPALPPVAFQEAVISIGLNAAMFLAFLMGIYTTVFFGTVYLYVTRKASQAQATVVIATITMIYILNTAQLAIHWQMLKSSTVDSGETRTTIFVTAYFIPAWGTLASLGCTAAANILADGLLIWRCFYVWNRSRLAISLPFFFLVAETGIYSSFIILYSVINPTPSFGHNRQGIILSRLIVSGYLSTFASTISSTLLIVYRIYNSISIQDNHYKKRFMHVVDVLVQSAAVYSLALLVAAIVGIVVATSEGQINLTLFAVLKYEGCAILFFVSGIAPTIMVARVALTADRIVAVDSKNVRISGLQFGIGEADRDSLSISVNSGSPTIGVGRN